MVASSCLVRFRPVWSRDRGSQRCTALPPVGDGKSGDHASRSRSSLAPILAPAASWPSRAIAGAGWSVTIGARRHRPVPLLHRSSYPGNGALMQAFEATNYYFDQAAKLPRPHGERPDAHGHARPRGPGRGRRSSSIRERSAISSATGCSTTMPAGRSRGACAIIPRSIRTKPARWPA